MSMQVNPVTGWLSNVEHRPSAHFSARPAGVDISLLVIHNISLPPGQFGTGHIQQFFLGSLDVNAHPYFDQIADLRVSAHFLIERDGKITQFVSCLDRAWHAGKSCFAGRDNCNDFSVGVELEGTDDQSYTQQQYVSLIAVTQALRAAFPSIAPERITGHEHIAPGRKTDPGPYFDWAYYRTQLLNTAPGGPR